MWPSSAPRILSIEEANALVPELNALVGAQLEMAEAIQTRLAKLSSARAASARASVGGGGDTEAKSSEVVDITVYDSDAEHVRELKVELSGLILRYRAGWQKVQSLGAVVKDTSTGLLDFYGRVDDRLVWLCWKYPETSIDFYHELDAGFSGRKPLDDVKKRMLN